MQNWWSSVGVSGNQDAPQSNSTVTVVACDGEQVNVQLHAGTNVSQSQSFINTIKVTHLHEPERNILLYYYYYNINFIQLTQNNKICIITIIINIEHTEG